VKKIWVGTPYVKERTLEEVEYWRSKGFEVIGYDGLGKVKGVEISNTPVFTVYRLVKRNIDRVINADAVYIACTALSTYEAVTYLYEDLGMPVISENTATMWGSLRKLRIKGRIPGINI